MSARAGYRLRTHAPAMYNALAGAGETSQPDSPILHEGARGGDARFNRQPTPQCITCTPFPRTASSDTSEVYPVDTCRLGLAHMHQRGIITRCRVRVGPRTQT